MIFLKLFRQVDIDMYHPSVVELEISHGGSPDVFMRQNPWWKFSSSVAISTKQVSDKFALDFKTNRMESNPHVNTNLPQD